MSQSLDDEKLGGNGNGNDEDDLEDLEATTSAPDASDDAEAPAEVDAEAVGEAPPMAGGAREAGEAGEEGDDDDQAVHPADAVREAKPRTIVPAKQLPLDPQARDGLIRCLQARILELETTLAHATEVAAKDSFFSRWPTVVGELRVQALRRLEELQRS